MKTLKNNVDGVRTEREFKDAAYRISVLRARVDNWPYTRLDAYKARDIYEPCAPKSQVMCLNLANRAQIDADLSVQFNQLLNARSAAGEEKAKAQSEHFASTKKSLD